MTRLQLMRLLTVTAILACGISIRQVNSAAAVDSDRSNRCKWLEQEGKGIIRFSVLPGGGWDNLRNRDMGLVADLSFRDCSLSDDGTYVTPRDVVLYPKRESQVSLISHVMEHYENYTSTTSLSINLGGNGIIHGFGIDGKMSEEFQQVKKTAVSSKTQIGRTQQRYNMYTAQLQPDFRLSESFKNRLLDIGNALINNQTSMARYLSDLIVRDFGTHVVTSVDAGAILEKLDYFNRNALTTSVFTSNKLSQCLSVNFAKVFGMNYDVSMSVTTEDVKQYVTSVQKTTVNTHGGPPIGAKIDLAQWEAHLRENLVAIDKIGEPIFGVISERSLTQIPLPYLRGVIGSVKDAVMRYYKANEVKGCLDPNSPSFDPVANVEGSCRPPLTNFSFAGVYQTCRESRPDLGLGVCGNAASPEQRNPITGDFRCPTGYEPVKLVTTAGGVGTRCFERHKRCWGFWTCSDGYDCYNSYATLDSYWCSAIKDAQLPADSGMVYGGAYSPRFNNPAVDAKACGSGYRPYTVGRDIQLCLSRDMNDAAAYRIPLGGFFTCKDGNPLAEPGRRIVASFGRLSAAQESPKRCPEGFSQSTLDLVDGCALMQCTRGAGDLGLAVAKRPPFEDADFRYAGPPVTTVEADGRLWLFNGSAWVYLGYTAGGVPAEMAPAGAASSSGGSGSSGSGLSSTSIGGLFAVLAVIGLAILAALGFALRRRRIGGGGGLVGRLRGLRQRNSGGGGGGGSSIVSGGSARRGGYRQLDEDAAAGGALIDGGGRVGGVGGYGATTGSNHLQPGEAPEDDSEDEVDEVEVVTERPARRP